MPSSNPGSEAQKRATQRVRLEVLEHYSPGGIECRICHEGWVEFMALDHINGGGNLIKRSGSSAYWRSFKRDGWPEGFRVLCFNCNLKHGCRDRYWKGWRRKLDSELSQNPLTVAVRRYAARNPDKVKEQARQSYLKLKAEVIIHYGEVCACCGADDLDVLSIDHINGDGAAHRRELRARGEYFGYHWLKTNNFPEGFRVLCLNCNFARGFWGRCPHEAV